MDMRDITVKVMFDYESMVWVASSDDLPGLNTWATTPDELERKVNIMICELASNLLDVPNIIPYHLQRYAQRRDCA